MVSRLTPIGFEGMFSEPTSFIGFEQYEVEQKESAVPAYPVDDIMPSLPNQTLRNNTHSDYPSTISKTIPTSSHSLKHDTNSHMSAKKSLSYPQLFAIYNEIVNEWSKEQWLIFSDNHTDTYLTLNSNTNPFLTVQMAINQYNLTSGSSMLLSQPECLLIRTKSKARTLFSPNSILTLENLCNNNIGQRLFQYKLMAIVCYSNETNSQLMFYRDFQSDNWYIYYNQSMSSHAHSKILSDEEKFQLESFIQQENHIDLTKFPFPLSALYNHPIIYVYMPEKNNEKSQKI